MTDDWFTALAAVFLATLAVSNARAEIKLGVASPLTGHHAWSGGETRAGAYMTVEPPDAAGGILDQSLEPALVDDFRDPDRAIAAANKLAADGVPFVVGHQCPGAANWASSIYEHAGIGQARSRRKDDGERAAAIEAELSTLGRI